MDAKLKEEGIRCLLQAAELLSVEGMWERSTDGAHFFCANSKPLPDTAKVGSAAKYSLLGAIIASGDGEDIGTAITLMNTYLASSRSSHFKLQREHDNCRVDTVDRLFWVNQKACVTILNCCVEYAKKYVT